MTGERPESPQSIWTQADLEAAYERGLEDAALKAEEYADGETDREVQGALRLFANRLRALKQKEE
jgi:hypothetical protein